MTVAMTGDGVNDAPALKESRHWDCHGIRHCSSKEVQLLWVNLVTDGLPATAIGFNKQDSACYCIASFLYSGLFSCCHVVRYANHFICWMLRLKTICYGNE